MNQSIHHKDLRFKTKFKDQRMNHLRFIEGRPSRAGLEDKGKSEAIGREPSRKHPAVKHKGLTVIFHGEPTNDAVPHETIAFRQSIEHFACMNEIASAGQRAESDDLCNSDGFSEQSMDDELRVELLDLVHG